MVSFILEAQFQSPGWELYTGLIAGDRERRLCKIDHRPVAGSTLRYHDGLKRLVRLTGLPLSEAIRTTSLNQAESLGLGKRGKLEKDDIADIVLLDENLDVRKTICGGCLKWQC